MRLRVWDPPSSPSPLSAPGAAPRAPETKGGGRGSCGATLYWGRTEPGWTRCPLPREQRRQLWGELPDPAPGGENAGLGARHRHGTGTGRDAPGPGSFVLAPTRSTRRGASRGGSARLGGGAQHGWGGVQDLGCSPVLCIAVAVRSRPEHPRVLPGAVRRGHPGDTHRRGYRGGCRACVGPRGPGMASWLLRQPPRPRAVRSARSRRLLWVFVWRSFKKKIKINCCCLLGLFIFF